MRVRTSKITMTRRIALVVVVSLAVTLLGTDAAAADPSRPPNPSDSQLSKARATKVALTAQVGKVSARIAVIQGQIRTLDADAELAEQKLALALQRQHQAKQAASAAKKRVTEARAQVEQAQRAFVSYVQASYMSGEVGGTTGTLLTATDPGALLERGTLRAYESSHQITVIGRLQRATVGKSNADAAARRALAKQVKAAHEAQVAQQNVLSALAAAKSEKGSLGRQLAAERRSLQAAQIKLTGLTDQRAAFRAWQKEQARLAAERARQLRERQLAQQRAAAANAARLAASSRTEHSEPTSSASSNSSSPNSGSEHRGGSGSSAPKPSGGGWTAAKGRQAANRALRYLGTPYSWAAGNASGPTYGVSEPGAAWNDSNIRGFDCSGLTLYAWAPWLSLDHYSVTQYSQAGSYHPSIDNLMPGDLVFWSPGGTISHEAIYVGNGNVIQAPQSGDVVKITNVYNVESGYYGATRPLT